jgi:hypothetical protein
METVVGIFKSRDDSCRAASYLKSSGIPDNHLNVLMPGASEEELKTVPTTGRSLQVWARRLAELSAAFWALQAV